MRSSASSAPACWAISDGAAGNERQALALARALGLVPRVRRIRVREPWAAFAPWFGFGARSAIRTEDGEPLSPPWPAIAIGCGRRAALVTRLLRDWSRGRTFTVQILDPRIDTSAFDVVVVPQHDRASGTNVIRSIGALNTVDHAWLAQARAKFAMLAALSAPRTVVLIGGSNRAQRLDAEYFDALLERLAARHAAQGGSFLVSVSRRTPESIAARLRNAFAKFPGVFWSGGDEDRAPLAVTKHPAEPSGLLPSSGLPIGSGAGSGGHLLPLAGEGNTQRPAAATSHMGENPYAGFLAWADRLVVTPDSVNMLSEACATGKPVYTFATRPITGKLAAFHADLLASGHLRQLDDRIHHPQPAPLEETAAIGELVRARWQRFVAGNID